MPEFGIQKIIQKVDENGNPLFDDGSGGETTTDNGMPILLPAYFDENGEETTDVTDLPVIITVPSTTNGAQPVYLDDLFNKVFVTTAHRSYETDFSGNPLFIGSTGFKIDEPPSILVNNGGGVDFNVYEVGGNEFGDVEVAVSVDQSVWHVLYSESHRQHS